MTDRIACSSATLSAAARSVWAKSSPNPCFDGNIEQWLPLHRHLLDTAGVAERLWDGWLAPHIRSLIASAVGDEHAARALAIWLASVHDVGKASPAFSVQVRTLTQRMHEHGLKADPSLAEASDRSSARHELVGYLAIREWLIERHSLDKIRARKIASVVAAHHGRPPALHAIQQVSSSSRLIGDGAWGDVRRELIETMSSRTLENAQVSVWAHAPLPQHALALLSAFVIVADWIASNDSLFGLAKLGENDVDAEGRVERAWSQLGLPERWTPAAPDDDVELFQRRFDLTNPRPAQLDLMQLARTCAEPSLLIVEAAMGTGKTEGALAAAEILATRFSLSGVFIGLPTQATADGMFARSLRWAERLDLETPINVFLAHGKSALNADFDQLRFRGIGDRYESRRDVAHELAIAHHWFGDPKRGPLADLVIGTIDQALVGSLRSKHVMLRHLSLASKVVILDEVHAFDAYTGTYIEGLLRWLGAYEVPVIMLSATLPANKRKAFVAAYERGRQSNKPPRRARRGAVIRGAAPADDPLAMLDGDIGYPVITRSARGAAPHIVHPESSEAPVTVAVERIDDDLDALRQSLATALDAGGTAVVIRNTVDRVQETAAYLRSATDIPVIVGHSRFLAVDRAAKDRQFLRLFGKDGERPDRMIVVASQVVEQSLDIDFDLMVSDVAPIDLILQRIGRLHRHAGRVRARGVRSPRLILTGVDWKASPPRPVRGSIAVYGAHLLLRTLALLEGKTSITLPADIPHLVQAAYGDGDIHPAAWDAEIREARARAERVEQDKRLRAETFRLEHGDVDGDLLGWVEASVDDVGREAALQAAVRDGEETLEVLVIQDIDGALVTPTWLAADGGMQLPTTEPPNRRLTRTVLGCALRLPVALCARGRIDAQIRELELAYPVQAWHGSHALRGELVLTLDADGTGRLGDDALHYDPHDGLSFVRQPRFISPESEARW